MFTVDKDYQIQQPTSQFFASQLINLEWVQPGSGEHRLFPAAADIEDPAGHALVTAYATLRPDGQWSLLWSTATVESPPRFVSPSMTLRQTPIALSRVR